MHKYTQNAVLNYNLKSVNVYYSIILILILIKDKCILANKNNILHTPNVL